MKSLLIFCLAAFIGIQFSTAQTTITGKVSSKTNGTPISGAVIKAKDVADISVVTDANGNYSIEVPAGVTVLQIKARGFAVTSENIGEKKVINFVMTPVSVSNDKTVHKAKPADRSATKMNSEKN